MKTTPPSIPTNLQQIDDFISQIDNIINSDLAQILPLPNQLEPIIEQSVFPEIEQPKDTEAQILDWSNQELEKVGKGFF